MGQAEAVFQIDNDKIQRAVRAARLVKIALGSTVALLFLVWLSFGFLQETAFEMLANIFGLAWFAAFVSIPILSFAWLARFGALRSTVPELRLTTWLMVTLLLVWVLIIVGFFLLLAMIARGLLNFI